MTLDPIRLTQELIIIPSITGNEHAVVEFLAARLDRLGWKVTLQPLADALDRPGTGGRANIYATVGHPEVVFSTHLDTVPPQLHVREDAYRIFGRGACDAKGIAAAMIAAAEQLRAGGEQRIGLLFVCGEEEGSDGAKRAAELEPKGRFLINGEPTENRLSVAQKGTLKILVSAHGTAAHSGYPELGDSAIEHLLDALQRMRAVPLPVDPVLGPSTLNIGLISGGVASNVVAPEANATLYLRTVGPTAAVEAALLAAAGSDIDLTFIAGIPPALAPSLPGWPSTTVGYASDLAYHGAWGTCYQLGPGTIHLAHTDHESIAKAELREGVALYVRLATELLASGESHGPR